MTAYATRSDLAKWGLPQALLDTIPTATQDAQLSSAASFADSIVRARYNLPLTAWEDDWRQKICEMAARGLITTEGFTAGSNDEAIIARAVEAERWFFMVAKRQIHPNITDSGAQRVTPVVVSDEPRGW